MISNKTKKIISDALTTKFNCREEIEKYKNKFIDCLEKISYAILTPEERILVEKYPKLVKRQPNDVWWLTGHKTIFRIIEILNNIIGETDNIHYPLYLIDSDIFFRFDMESRRFPIIFSTDDNNLESMKELFSRAPKELLLELKESVVQFVKIYNSKTNILNQTNNYLNTLEDINELKIEYPELYNLYKDERKKY